MLPFKDKVNVSRVCVVYFPLILCHIIAFSEGFWLLHPSPAPSSVPLYFPSSTAATIYIQMYIKQDISSKARKYEQYMCTHTHANTVQSK